MNSKKTKKIVLISIFVLLIILMIVYRIMTNLEEEQKNYSVHDPNMPIISSKNLVEDVYKGNIDTLDISNRVQILFETYLPLVVIDAVKYNDEDLKKFYDEETEHGLIYLNMGIDNYDDFKEFINQLSKLNCDLTSVDTVEYDKDSYIQSDNEDSMEFEILYNNGNNSLKCKAHIPKTKVQNENIIIRFEILEVINK